MEKNWKNWRWRYWRLVNWGILRPTRSKLWPEISRLWKMKGIKKNGYLSKLRERLSSWFFNMSNLCIRIFIDSSTVLLRLRKLAYLWSIRKDLLRTPESQMAKLRQLSQVFRKVVYSCCPLWIITSDVKGNCSRWFYVKERIRSFLRFFIFGMKPSRSPLGEK